MIKQKKMVEIYRAASEAEARIIKSFLESNGIPCLMKANAAPSVHAFAIDGMGEVVILVWEDVIEKAIELIREEEDA
ncbi:MAG: hypothetical protein GH158_01395 [Dehalococcoidia bacterium]|nr:hypothetical protein [Dehalococcoidia bacterium]MQY80886.1 hypothetical protein [Dehalococcoidia bacterium]TET48645.1 MAG: DUF2007 domain-containing protein [Dehalococcoidia bacterium]